MAFDELVLSDFLKVKNGVAKLEHIMRNAISRKNVTQCKKKYTIEIQNLSCDHPFHWNNSQEMLSLISPHVTQENRFDASEKTTFCVLASAISQKGLISHSIDLSTPVPFVINVWTNSHLEIHVCEFDSSTMQHKVLRSFNGLLHIHIREID